MSSKIQLRFWCHECHRPATQYLDNLGTVIWDNIPRGWTVAYTNDGPVPYCPEHSSAASVNMNESWPQKLSRKLGHA